MKMFRKIIILLYTAILVLTFSACEKYNTRLNGEVSAVPSGLDAKAAQAKASDTAKENNPTLDISFKYVRQSGIATNQFAVWIENESGELIKTLFVTKFTANGGYKKRKDAIPTWVEKSKINQGNVKGIDTVTGSTPKTGDILYTWDCKDEKGNPVSSGNYKFFVEGTTRWESRVLYSGTIEIGGNKVSVEAVPKYSTEEAKKSNMIGQVKAEYNN